MKSNSLKFIIIVLILQLSIKDQAIAQSGQNDTIVADEVIYNFLDISFDFNYPQGFFKENT